VINQLFTGGINTPQPFENGLQILV